MRRAQRFARAAFPGDARVWRVAALVFALAALGILVSLFTPRDYYTGTDSVRTRSFPAELGPGQLLCTAQRIPADTGRIEMEIDTRQLRRSAMSLELRIPGEPTVRSRPTGPPTTGRAKVDFPIPVRASSPDFVPGTVCVRSAGRFVFFGGTGGHAATDPPVTVAGRPLLARIAVWYRPPAGHRRSLASLAPTILLRAGLFRPGFVGRWTYVAILVLLMPGLLYAGTRLMALAAAGGRTRLPPHLAVAAIAFAGAAAWSLVTPSFNAPDESEHFAYAQYLAETGHAPHGSRSPYSSDEQTAIDHLRLFSSNEHGDGKPPWLPVQEADWAADRTHIPPGAGAPPRDDGGGETTSTSAHSPLYYSLLVPAYGVTSGRSIFVRLWAMRLVSALLGAVVAACALLVVRELLPRRPLLSVAAGLLVAFQPMFSFMSGAVDNDSGVNAAAAVLVLLLVRGLVRGLTLRLAGAIGVALAVTPLMKGTGFAIYPAAAVAVGVMVWRARPGGAWVRPAAAMAGATAGVFALWAVISAAFNRAVITTPGGDAPGAGRSGLGHPVQLAEYLWQVFLPRLSFMTDWWPGVGWPFYEIWVVRGFGAFGWYAMTFPDWVYWVVVAAMLVLGALAVVTLWRERVAVRRLWAPLAVLTLVVAGVIAGVHSYYLGTTRLLPGVIPEQGRYAFPAITALAMIAVGALLALPRRWLVPAAAGLAAAMMSFDWAAQLMALSRFYS